MKFVIALGVAIGLIPIVGVGVCIWLDYQIGKRGARVKRALLQLAEWAFWRVFTRTWRPGRID